MCQYVATVALVGLALAAGVPSPLRVTIDCRSEEDSSHMPKVISDELLTSSSRFDISTFCNLIDRAIPQSIKDGKFVNLPESDLVGYSDTVAPVAVVPPKGFIHSGFPKLKPSRLKIPKLDVPKLKPMSHSLRAPRVGPTMLFSPLRTGRYEEDESSAERMEKFKKGVQKMLHFVKVLSRIDQYLSERTRILVDKLTKTFSD